MQSALWVRASVIVVLCGLLGCGWTNANDPGTAGGDVRDNGDGPVGLDGGDVAGTSGADGDGAGSDVDACVGKKLEHETCSANGECCGYPQLACSSVGNPGGQSTCVRACNQSNECESGCCFSIPGVPTGYCGAASLCLPLGPVIDAGSVDTVMPVTGTSCVLPNFTCSANGDCCGYASQPRLSACSSFSGSGLVCAAECAIGADCLSGCCVPILGSVDRLCSPATSCR